MSGRIPDRGGGWGRYASACLLELVLAVALLFALLAAPAEAKPRRIVSLNLCADQLLMLLVQRERIASVSYIAADPQMSAIADEVDDLHLNYGTVEEVLALKPDLVLATTFSTRPTVPLLRRFGFRVVEVPVEASIDSVARNIRLVADAVGEGARGEAAAAAFEARLAAAGPAPEARPLLAFFWANGYTSGTGTLAHDVAVRAGFRNLAAERGVAGTLQMPLEVLIAAQPDALVVGRLRRAPALATEALRHPALRQAFAGRPAEPVPDSLWVCGTPLVADAIDRLTALRRRTAAGKGAAP